LITDFEKMFELGIVETPELNSKVWNQQRSGRRKAPPTLFRPFSPMNSGFGMEHRLRRCALFFRQEAGSKSRAIQNDLSERQKEFLLWKYF